MIPPLTTSRLLLRPVTPEDAPFILELLNTPGWLQYIGDRGVKTLEDAARYITERMMESYRKSGLGMYLVELIAGGAAVGLCGLVRREGLEDTDIGFALLPEHEGMGYALEAARAVMSHAQHVLRLERIVAITTPDNRSSIRLVERLGLQLEKEIRLPGSEEVLHLFGINFRKE